MKTSAAKSDELPIIKLCRVQTNDDNPSDNHIQNSPAENTEKSLKSHRKLKWILRLKETTRQGNIQNQW